jgi:prophage antirepressor-like protein
MEIQIFENSQFGEVRVVEVEGKTYFVGIDVARALGYQKPNDAITRYCRASVKHGVIDNFSALQMCGETPPI